MIHQKVESLSLPGCTGKYQGLLASLVRGSQQTGQNRSFDHTRYREYPPYNASGTAPDGILSDHSITYPMFHHRRRGEFEVGIGNDLSPLKE